MCISVEIYWTFMKMAIFKNTVYVHTVYVMYLFWILVRDTH